MIWLGILIGIVIGAASVLWWQGFLLCREADEEPLDIVVPYDEPAAPPR